MRNRLLAGLVVLLSACGGDGGPLRVSGTIEIREIAVAPLVAGRLIALRRDEGDTVRAGDTIAILTRPGLEERLREAVAREAAARARVRDLEAGARPQELEAAEASLRAAVADSVRAANDYVRIQRLFVDSVATPSQLDAVRSAAENADARTRQAREQLDLVAAGARAHQLTAARREAEALAAARAALEAERDELVLTASSPGVVLLRLAEAGEPVAAGAPVVTVGLTTQPWVRAFVGQGDIARVVLGAPVRVLIDGYPDTAFAGVVTGIDAEAEFIPRAALTERERADLVFGIRVRIDDAGGRLKPGIPVDLEIPPAPGS